VIRPRRAGLRTGLPEPWPAHRSQGLDHPLLPRTHRRRRVAPGAQPALRRAPGAGPQAGTMSRPGVAAALADPMTQTNRSHSRPPGDERDHGGQAGGDRDQVVQAARSAGMPLDDHPAGARTIDAQAALSASGDFWRERSLYPGQGCLPAGTASSDEGRFECSPRARRDCRPDRRTPSHRTAANGRSRLISAASSPKRLTWASTQYLTPPWCTATAVWMQ
jgi:hypothetical protein